MIAIFVDKVISAEEAILAFKEGSLKPLIDLYKATALCNNAIFDTATINYPTSERKVLGNPTNSTMLKFIEDV